MKPRQDPLVSIALPVYQAEKTLGRAIRSIIYQTYLNWELLVIDDGSTDNSPSIARSFTDSRIKVFSDGKRKGISSRLNQAVELSNGKYFGRMDADDVSFPERLQRQVEFLEEHPCVDLLGTGILLYSGQGVVKGIMPVKQRHEDICKRPWWGFYLPHPTWLGKREWFSKYKYRPEADKAEDQDLLFRSFTESRFACLPQVLLGYREEPRRLKKMFVRRYVFFRSIFFTAISNRQYLIAIKLLLLQPAKLMGDCANITMGFERLRNPILSAPMPLVKYWRIVWETVG